MGHVATFDEDSSESRVSVWLVFFSLLLHLIVGLVYWKWIEHDESTEAVLSPLKTELISESQLRTLQRSVPAPVVPRDAQRVVETELVNTPSKVTDKARYLGEKTQRVEKETVAPQFGSVKGGAKSQARTTTTQKFLEKVGIGTALPPDPQPSISEGGGDERLTKGSFDAVRKDVAIGAQTVLNTDEYVYASFFNRVKSEVAPRWEPLIQKILREQGRRIGAGSFSTEMQFWLDGDGQILRVEVLHPSGERSFDEAAREALRRLPKMPNPPTALREADGSYRMQLGFMVFLERGGAIRTEYIPDPRL